MCAAFETPVCGRHRAAPNLMTMFVRSFVRLPITAAILSISLSRRRCGLSFVRTRSSKTVLNFICTRTKANSNPIYSKVLHFAVCASSMGICSTSSLIRDRTKRATARARRICRMTLSVSRPRIVVARSVAERRICRVNPYQRKTSQRASRRKAGNSFCPKSMISTRTNSRFASNRVRFPFLAVSGAG